MDSSADGVRGHRIAPFGNPRIKGCLRLPADYRGLPRPSSPAIAKASVMRLNSLPAEIEKTLSGVAVQGLCLLPSPVPEHGDGTCLGSVVILFAPDYIYFIVTWIVKELVGAPGLEPGTSSLSEKRSNQLSYAPENFSRAIAAMPFGIDNSFFTIGGAEGIRTHDILLAKQALYQLSYGPVSLGRLKRLLWEASSAIPCDRWLAALLGRLVSLKRR